MELINQKKLRNVLHIDNLMIVLFYTLLFLDHSVPWLVKPIKAGPQLQNVFCYGLVNKSCHWLHSQLVVFPFSLWLLIVKRCDHITFCLNPFMLFFMVNDRILLFFKKIWIDCKHCWAGKTSKYQIQQHSTADAEACFSKLASKWFLGGVAFSLTVMLKGWQPSGTTCKERFIRCPRVSLLIFCSLRPTNPHVNHET